MPTDTAPFAVSFVDGVTLDKWRRRWGERVPGTRLELTLVPDADQVRAVRDGEVAMAFVRDLEDREGLHVIPLYSEVPVVVVGTEHPVAAYDEIPLEDLGDEVVLDDPDLSTSLKVETVAAGTGVLLVPLSVARAHHRKDVVAVPVIGMPESLVGLAWRTDTDDPLVETFIGIVRGRTERSSRGDATTAERKRPSRATPPPASGRGRQQPGRGQGRGGRGRPRRG